MSDQADHKRNSPRVTYTPAITVVGAGGRRSSGKLKDLSVDGAGAIVDVDFADGEAVTLTIPEIGAFSGTIRRSSPPNLNIKFDSLTPSDKEKIADYLQVRRVLFRS